MGVSEQEEWGVWQSVCACVRVRAREWGNERERVREREREWGNERERVRVLEGERETLTTNLWLWTWLDPDVDFSAWATPTTTRRWQKRRFRKKPPSALNCLIFLIFGISAFQESLTFLKSRQHSTSKFFGFIAIASWKTKFLGVNFVQYQPARNAGC